MLPRLPPCDPTRLLPISLGRSRAKSHLIPLGPTRLPPAPSIPRRRASLLYPGDLSNEPRLPCRLQASSNPPPAVETHLPSIVCQLSRLTEQLSDNRPVGCQSTEVL
ncbi:unnamed protein product [Linum trigynum]|uniref:Uncharacterized protein n=1 Tax=Linum trigynum TaxID=586398 RepID=A0AAV2EF99_9ROSI